MRRDPERTKRRILAAALREFSLRGFAGARIDTIARRARVNKRMLYHYFGDKQDLYREIFRRKLTEKTEVTQATPFDPAELDQRNHVAGHAHLAARGPRHARD